MATAADKRLTLNHFRIEHEGVVWNVDAKFNPAASILKVYRVYGDITQPELLDEALQLLADEMGMKAQDGPRKPGRPTVQRVAK